MKSVVIAVFFSIVSCSEQEYNPAVANAVSKCIKSTNQDILVTTTPTETQLMEMEISSRDESSFNADIPCYNCWTLTMDAVYESDQGKYGYGQKISTLKYDYELSSDGIRLIIDKMLTLGVFFILF